MIDASILVSVVFCEGGMRLVKKLFLLMVVCSFFVGGAQVCLAKGTGGNPVSFNDVVTTVRPGQVVIGMFWAGAWASVANWCISGIFDPKPRKIVDLAVFLYATYHYVAQAYRTNKQLAEQNSIQKK